MRAGRTDEASACVASEFPQASCNFSVATIACQSYSMPSTIQSDGDQGTFPTFANIVGPLMTSHRISSSTRRMDIANETCVSFCNQTKAKFGYLTRVTPVCRCLHVLRVEAFGYVKRV